VKLTPLGDGKMRRQDSRWLISPHGAFHCVRCAMPPVPPGGTQKHVFVLTPCFEITRKLLAPSVGLVLTLRILQKNVFHTIFDIMRLNRQLKQFENSLEKLIMHTS